MRAFVFEGLVVRVVGAFMALLTVLMGVAGAAPASAQPAGTDLPPVGPWQIERVSVGPAGVQSDGDSGGAELSADASTVAFETDSTNLLPGVPTGSGRNIVVRDLGTGEIKHGNRGASGGRLTYSSMPDLTADGRVLTFASGFSDSRVTWRRDLVADVASSLSTGVSAQYPRVNADGSRLVTVQPGTSWDERAHVWAHQTGEQPASVLVARAQGENERFGRAAVSADGSTVAAVLESSPANRLHVQPLPAVLGQQDLPPVDVLPVSRPGFIRPALSADGRYVLYVGGGEPRLFDRVERTDTLLVDLPDGAYTSGVDLSDDGQVAAFSVISWSDGFSDLWVHNRRTNRTEVVASIDGTQGAPSLSADGMTVAFTSDRDDVVAGDDNGYADVFVARRVDGEPPAWPAGAALEAAEVGATFVRLTWPAASDDSAVAGYRLTRDGHSLGEVTTTTYTATELEPERTYRFTVTPVDDAGLAGAELVLEVQTGGTAEPGEAALTATPIPGGARLEWDAAAQADGYRVHRATSSGEPQRIAEVTTTSFDDLGIDADTTYRWFVTALRDGVEQPHTVQATATTGPISLTGLAWTGQPAVGGQLTITITGDRARTATVTADIKTWNDPNGGLLTEPRPDTITLTADEDADRPGTYTATLDLAEGIAEITSISARLADSTGSGPDRTATRLPVSVLGAVVVNVDASADAIPSGRILVTSSARSSVERRINGGGAERFELGSGDIKVKILSARGTQLVLQDAHIRHGLTTALEITPRLPASLSVRVETADGAPFARLPVRISVGGGRYLLQTAGDGTAAVSAELLSGDDYSITVPMRDNEPASDGTATGALEPGRNVITVVPPPLAGGFITGVVTLPDGAPARGAYLVLSQEIDDRSWNSAAVADHEGRYRLEGLAGPGTLSISWSGQRSHRFDIELPDGNQVERDFQIDRDRAYTLDFDLYTRIGDGAWDGPVNLDRFGTSMRATVYAPSGLRAGRNTTEIMGRPGDEIEVCADGGVVGLPAECTTLVLGEEPQLSAELRLESVAIVKGRFVNADGSEGPLPGDPYFFLGTMGRRFLNRNSPSFVYPLPAAGTYTLGGAVGFFQVSRTFTAEVGETVDLGDIQIGTAPWFATSSVAANPQMVLPDQTTELRLAAHPGTTGTYYGVSLRLPIPEGTELVPGSVLVDGQQVAAELSGSEAVVQVGDRQFRSPPDPEQAWVVRYRLRVTEGGEAGKPVRIAPTVSWSTFRGGPARSQLLGSTTFHVTGVTLEAPVKTNRSEVVLGGLAPAGETVRVFEGSTLLGEVLAGPGGHWDMTVTLPPRGSVWTYELHAEAGDDPVRTSDMVALRYDRRLRDLQRVEVRQNGARTQEFIPHEGVARFPYVFAPIPVSVLLTFPEDARVVDPVVRVGVNEAPARPIGGGTYMAEVPATHQTVGAIEATYDVEPTPMGVDEPTPSEAQLRAMLPDAFVDVTDVEADKEVSGQSETIRSSMRMPALGENARMSSAVTLEWGQSYAPSQRDLDIARASGTHVWGLRTSGTFNDGGTSRLRLEAYVPEELLPRTGDVAARAQELLRSALTGEATPGQRSFTASPFAAGAVVKITLEKVFFAVDQGNTIYGSLGFKDRLDRLERLLDRAMSRCGSDSSKAHYRDMILEHGEKIARDEAIKLGMSAASGVVGAFTFGAGFALWGVGFVVGLGLDAANDSSTDLIAQFIAEDPDCQNEDDDDWDPWDPRTPHDPRSGRRPNSRRLADPVWIHDPSGYVYEAVESNRLEGVTATLTQGGSQDGPFEIWDAEWFGQTNPQISDVEGRYGWDVPEGWWQVHYSKDGYQPASSRVLKVLPPHFDVNVGMVSLAAPEIVDITALGGPDSAVTVTFDRYMRMSVRDEQRIRLLDAEGQTIPAEIVAVAPEDSPAGEPLTRTFKVLPDQVLPLGSTVTVVVDQQATAYNDRTIDAEVRRDITVQGVSFASARNQLDELAAAGGITAGLQAKVRHALDQAELWLSIEQQRPLAMTHIDRAIHLLLWQADVAESKPNQGNPQGLRALAEHLAALRSRYTE